MTESFISLFDLKKNGFFWAAAVGYFIGAFFAEDNLLYKLFKGNYHFLNGEFNYALLMAALTTFVFFMAAYAADSNWLYILFLSTGWGVVGMAGPLAFRAVVVVPQSYQSNIGGGPISGLICGFIMASVLVILTRKRPISILPFLISFPLAGRVN